MDEKAKRKERLERELRARLEPGETLLWSGQPQQGLLFRPCEPLAIYMSVGAGVLWLIVVFFLVRSLLHGPYPESSIEGTALSIPFTLVWMLIVLLGGPYYTVGRFFYDAGMRERTLYAVTDRRSIILSGLLWRFCRSRTYDRVRWIVKERFPSGRMSIWFGPRPPWHSVQGDYPVDQPPELSVFKAAYVHQVQHMRPAGLVSVRFGWFLFERIEDGEAVYALAEEARQRARSR
jgi:hypothetical protein